MSVWAILACRANSERLYCKPLQRIGGMPILDHMVANIRALQAVDGIVLAIAEGRENECFIGFAEERGLPYVLGPEDDVLARVLTAVNRFDIETMFRVTTECPFLFADDAREIIGEHVRTDRDFTTILNLPVGATYELLHRRVLAAAAQDSRYPVLLSLYVRHHIDSLRMSTPSAPAECRRPEINLAVDHPGQLIYCQRAFDNLAGRGRPVNIRDLIRYHDSNPQVSSLVESIHEDVFAMKPDQTAARVWE